MYLLIVGSLRRQRLRCRKKIGSLRRQRQLSRKYIGSLRRQRLSCRNKKPSPGGEGLQYQVNLHRKLRKYSWMRVSSVSSG